MNKLTFILDKLAKIIVVPEHLKHIFVGAMVMGPDNCTQMACRRLAIIPRHHGEEVVDYMVVRDCNPVSSM
jgi:hypothetical protein